MAAEVEEVVVHADAVAPEHVSQTPPHGPRPGRGARPDSVARRPGCLRAPVGSARRSTLPLGSSGSASSTTTAPAPCSPAASPRAPPQLARPGRRRRRARRTRPAAGRPARRRAATAAPRARPGARAARPRSRPSSIRKPRSLTWWSAARGTPARRRRASRAQVAGAVHPRRPARRERVGHEALGREARRGRGSRAPRRRRRCRARPRRPPAPGRSARVEHVAARVFGDRPADRHRARRGIVGRDLVDAAADDGLGRPVLVEQRGSGRVRAPEREMLGDAAPRRR